MSMRDVIEPLGMLVEQHQEEIEEHAVGEQNLAGDVTTIQPALNWFQQASSAQHGTLCRTTFSDKTSVAGLSPIQNQWIRRYTRPDITVNLALWAEQLPEGFSLEYLLSHALENGWDLTEVGWDRAYELGVAQRFENTASNAPSKYEGWLSNKNAAERLSKGLSKAGIERSSRACQSTICKARDRNKLNTNGIKGRGSLYDPIGVDALALKIRNVGLPDGDDDDEDE